jgi:DNA polymerase
MSDNLAEIMERLRDCRRCALSETRTNLVFGVGNPKAEVMFIGEAPGKQEDLGAEPFIGAAGKYLNSLLALAGLKREEIYIANVLKCRPPENRDPRPEEIEACTPFLREQVRAINPAILVTLGNFATRFILKTDRGITGLRGQVHITGRFSVLPIFHPAAAIYDRNKEAVMEDDFRLLGRLIVQRREERAQREPQAAQPGDAQPGGGQTSVAQNGAQPSGGQPSVAQPGGGQTSGGQTSGGAD